LVLQAGDLVAQGHELFGQGLEGPVIFDIVPDLRGLIRRNTMGELLSVKEALQDVVGTAGGGGSTRSGGEELFAQGAATKAVNGLHLEENGLPLVKEVIEIRFHALNVSI
jgi:hypothetical protein